MQDIRTPTQAAIQALIPARGRLIVGVSGGADSTALLFLLAAFLPKARQRLRVVHVQHGLRGIAAERDLNLVQRHCRQLEIPCLYYRSDTGKVARKMKLSLEAAGRLIRYDCLLDAALREQATAVLLAHHQTDQAETIMLNLLRGAGAQGLAAMRSSRPFPHAAAPLRLKLIRPLLGISKTELISYLRQHRIAWREDRSNRDPIFTRNRIRYRLLPYLEREYNPQAVRSLAASSDILAREDAFLADLTAQAWTRLGWQPRPGTIGVDRAKFLRLPKALQYRVLAWAWDQAKIPQKSVVHLDQLRTLAGQGSSSASLPGRWVGRADHQRLWLEKTGENPWAQSEKPGPANGPYCLQATAVRMPKNFKLPPKSGYVLVDEQLWPKSVALRPARSGDFMYALGMKNKKKSIKKILSELKVPREQRGCWPVLARGSELFWVFQGPLSEKVKLTAHTKKVLRISLEGKKNFNTSGKEPNLTKKRASMYEMSSKWSPTRK